MKRLIILLLLIPFSFAAEMEVVYFATLDYDNGDVILDKLELDWGYAPDMINMPEDKYRLELINIFDEVIYEYKFDFNLFVAPIGEMTETTELLAVPYDFYGKQINVYDSSDNLILVIDVSEYSDYCGDGYCNEIESEAICPGDCKEPFLDKYYMHLIVGLIIVLVALLLFIFLRRR